MSFNIKTDIGNGQNENAKAISNFYTGNEVKELSHNEQFTRLNETLNELLSISKAADVNLDILINGLKDPLLNLRDKLNTDINELNNILAFKELLPIFDSSLTINGLDKLPYKFIASSKKLYEELNSLKNDIAYVINNMRQKYKDSISSFLIRSHQLLYNIFKNLTETTNSLSSTKSKIAEISSYYLNETDTSYSEIIKKAKEIIDNYYIKEKELILPLINDMLNNFSEKAMTDSLKSIQSSLETIIDRIDNGQLTINLANNEDLKNTIDYLYNSKILVSEIITKVKEKFQENIGIQSNGYFTSQNDIDNNKNSYGTICQNAMTISESLDNNNLIDKIFDELMINFREQFIVLLNYMEKSKREKFPLKNDVLSNTLFNATCINQFDNNLKTEKMKIWNFIKDENNGYMDEVNGKIKSFKDDNGNSLQKFVDGLDTELSEIKLYNLDVEYNKLFILAKKSIDEIIDYNQKLSDQYFTNIKNSKSTHITKAFKIKYNAYIKSLSLFKSYIKNTLKNDLANKYKNIITEIRKKLQSIKSNDIMKKYSKQIAFTESHTRMIELLFERFDKYFADNLFNKNYLPLINKYINSAYDKLDTNEKNINTIYNKMSSLQSSSDTKYDYFLKEKSKYKCCKAKFIWCWRYGTCYKYYYQGYNVKGTNNHLSLRSIIFNGYVKDFDALYDNINSKFSNYINQYNNYLIGLDESLEIIMQNKLVNSNNNNYLNDISNHIKTMVKNNLGNNLLISSYNYYKNEISEKLPTELYAILQQWKNSYKNTYN